ncbi:MAG: hypothetical protein ACPG51_17780, partial [Thiolinea sp.]
LRLLPSSAIDEITDKNERTRQEKLENQLNQAALNLLWSGKLKPLSLLALKGWIRDQYAKSADGLTIVELEVKIAEERLKESKRQQETKEKMRARGSIVDPITPLYERWVDKGGLDFRTGTNQYADFIDEISLKASKGGVKSKDRKSTYKKKSGTIKKDLGLIRMFEEWFLSAESDEKTKEGLIAEIERKTGRSKQGVTQNINELIEYKNKKQNR